MTLTMSFDIIDLNNIANIDIVNVIVHDNVIIVNDIDIVNVNQTLSEVRCLYQPTWFDASASAGATCAYNLTISAQILSIGSVVSCLPSWPKRWGQGSTLSIIWPCQMWLRVLPVMLWQLQGLCLAMSVHCWRRVPEAVTVKHPRNGALHSHPEAHHSIDGCHWTDSEAEGAFVFQSASSSGMSRLRRCSILWKH